MTEVTKTGVAGKENDACETRADRVRRRMQQVGSQRRSGESSVGSPGTTTSPRAKGISSRLASSSKRLLKKEEDEDSVLLLQLTQKIRQLEEEKSKLVEDHEQEKERWKSIADSTTVVTPTKKTRMRTAKGRPINPPIMIQKSWLR